MDEKRERIGKFFNFLKDKEKKDIPLQAQFTFTPENISWDELAYNERDLDLIKQTDNIDKIVWDKVDQSNPDTLAWIFDNAPNKFDISKVDPNERKLFGKVVKNAADQVDWDKIKIDAYVKAVFAIRYGGDNVNWNNIDYSDYGTVVYLYKNKPDVLDLSKIDTENPRLADFINKTQNG